MEIKDIVAVGLTAEDFETLIAGIEAIPKKERAEELLQDTTLYMMSCIISKTQAEIQMKKMDDKRKKYNSQESLNDDLTILKSKLIQLKRLLAGNAATQAATDILSTPPIKTY